MSRILRREICPMTTGRELLTEPEKGCADTLASLLNKAELLFGGSKQKECAAKDLINRAYHVGAKDARRSGMGRERLLGIPEVCELTGLGKATASKVMKESGCAIRLHQRLYVLEMSFYAWLREREDCDDE